MANVIRENPKAFLFALLIHVVLIVALSLNLDWTQSHKVAAPQVDVIQAVMIDASKIRAAEEQQRKVVEEQRRQVEDERQRQAEEIKKRQQEEQRQAEQQKKIVEEKRRAEEEVKRKTAEAEKKRQEETQRQQAEAEKRRQQETEQKKKEEAEKKRKEEAEQKRKAEEERKRKEEAEQKRKADEAKRRAEEERLRQDQIAAEQAAINAARQKALASERDKYILLIQQRVSNKWVRPPDWRAGITCKVTVRLVPAGGTAQVIDARVVKSCGTPLFDRSVENAVFSASPLPVPTAPELMNEFREITFVFRPEE